MKLLKHLYQVMYDDIKDAEMLLDYAEQAKEEDMVDAAKYLASNALERASKSYKEAKTMFDDLIEKHNIDFEKETMGCLVEHMLDELDEWKDSIIKRIEKL